MIKLIPVIDIMHGQVVRGIAGERDKYRANQSQLVSGSDPVETVVSFIEKFSADSLYIADLDALTGSGRSDDSIRNITSLGIETTVDAATTASTDVQQMLKIGVTRVVIALESLKSLDQVTELIEHFGQSQLVFSLDLSAGQVLGALKGRLTPIVIAEEVYRLGIRSIIVLDLAGVGVSAGVPTLSLCQEIKSRMPELELWTGGGVRSLNDVRELDHAGVGGVLVASALHDGKITPAEWNSYVSED